MSQSKRHSLIEAVANIATTLKDTK